MKFQSAGRIIGWLKHIDNGYGVTNVVSIRRADYWLVEGLRLAIIEREPLAVSIRRADYWLVEVSRSAISEVAVFLFQSAGRIIGWLKEWDANAVQTFALVSIRRADYWLVEADTRSRFRLASEVGFNPPGGLLVG